MAQNIIRIRQIDEDDLLAFLQAQLGLTIGPSSAYHTFNESFQGSVIVGGQFTASGTSLFHQPAHFVSGFTSDSGITVHGVISGERLLIDTFELPSGTLGTARVGDFHLTGIPIYETGTIGAAILLPSGTVYGFRQIVNAPTWNYDTSGDLMPCEESSGVAVVTLCVAMGI